MKRTCLLVAPLLAASLCPPARAQEKTAPPAKPPAAAEKPADFMRWVGAGGTEGRFETAVVTYVDKKGRSVDLVGAVHIADRTYYDGLNELFEGYDALLYELVARKGTRPDPTKGKDSIISMLQRFMKDVLDLDFQLDAIDYSKKNFVHADLDPKRFLAKQKERGESMVTLMLRAMLIGLKQQQEGKGSKITPIHLLAALVSTDRSRYLKFLFAQELENMEQMLAVFGGDKAGASVIIGERNKEAMRVLDEQLAAGKKRIGIFYGAGHLPDMQDRLLERGFRVEKQRWLTAWDCMLPAAKKRQKKQPQKPQAKKKG